MKRYARLLVVTAMLAGPLGCSAADDAEESARRVLMDFVAAMQAEGVPTAASRFTDEAECARLKQILMPRIRRSFEQGDAKIRQEILGRDMPLAEIEAMSPQEFQKAFLWRSVMSGTDIHQPEVISSSTQGPIVTLVVRTQFTDLDGKRTEKVDHVRFRNSGSGYKLLLSPELEAFATVLASQ